MSDHDHERSSGAGRLAAGAAWAVLLLGLWLWGREVTDVRLGISAPTTGDMAAVGRPPEVELPPAHRPLGAALPQRVDVPFLGVQAPVVARGLDATGAIEPPPFEQTGAVGWYAAGVKPGAAGTALMVGHVDTETRPAVFYKLSSLKPGESVRVFRDDGKVAEFTVDDVQVVTRDHFDAQQAYGPRQTGRAELRLITCGGSFDRASRSYTANVIVSAYLTGSGIQNLSRHPELQSRPWSAAACQRTAGALLRTDPGQPGPVGGPLPPKPPTGLVLNHARTGCGSNPAPAREA